MSKQYTREDVTNEDFLEILKLLGDRGHWRTDIELEVVVAIYQNWGYEALVRSVEWMPGTTTDDLFIEEPKPQYLVN